MSPRADGKPLRFASVANEQAGWKEIGAQTEAAVRRLDAKSL